MAKSYRRHLWEAAEEPGEEALTVPHLKAKDEAPLRPAFFRGEEIRNADAKA